jgi:hypothetical protein
VAKDIPCLTKECGGFPKLTVAEQRANALLWARKQWPERPDIWDLNLSQKKAAKIRTEQKNNGAKMTPTPTVSQQQQNAREWAEKNLPNINFN